jgi:hypothetical protein
MIAQNLTDVIYRYKVFSKQVDVLKSCASAAVLGGGDTTWTMKHYEYEI